LIYYYSDPDFTVLGSRVPFAGVDASNHQSLWVTDATVAGTSEVQVAAASSGGLFGFGPSPSFTVLGSKALFAGHDANGHYGLWVTDGTAAGTSELADAPAYSFGLFYYQVNPDFTVLSSGKALFEGNDAIDHLNLWLTDGTSAGTNELMPAGADPSGLFYFDGQSTQDPDFTTFGGKALFKGEDASTKINLWVTDGM
jgi:ELWxxDGT repeat protein